VCFSQPPPVVASFSYWLVSFTHALRGFVSHDTTILFYPVAYDLIFHYGTSRTIAFDGIG